MGFFNNKRALTPVQKKDVLLRLYRVWITGDAQYLRFGQLLHAVFQETVKTKDEDRGMMDIFNIEDFDLIDTIEDKFKKLNKTNGHN